MQEKKHSHPANPSENTVFASELHASKSQQTEIEQILVVLMHGLQNEKISDVQIQLQTHQKGTS